MNTACHGGKNRKYAANSKLAKHAGMPQHLYLRFLCAKRAVCSWVPEFAAYFRGRFQKCGVKPRSTEQTPVLRFRDLRFCCRKSGCARWFPIFSPHFRKTRQRRASRSANRYEFRRKNNLLNAKTAYRRFPRTKPDVPSQGLFTVGTLRKNPISVNPLPASRSELRLSGNASVKLHASKKTPAIWSIPN